MKQSIFFLLIGLMLLGCSRKSTIPEITLAMNAPEAQLKISDLAENIRIITLETNDSVLLPGRSNLLVSKNDILSISEEEIHQFDPQGKHIRILAKKGRGPEDFSRAYSAKIDHKNRLLYLIEGLKSLKIYNLKDGKFIEHKKLAHPIMQILQIQGDTLLVQPSANRGDTLKYSLCLMNSDGEILKGLPCCHAIREFEMVNCYIFSDDKIRLQSADYPDSLFTVDHFQTTPYATVKCTNNDDPEFSLSPYPNFENSQWHLFSVTPISLKRNDKGIIHRVTLKKVCRFIVNKQNYTGKLLKELYIDPWDISVPTDNLISTRQLILPVKIQVIREQAEKQLKKGNISPALEKIYRNTKEEDNPILILGDYKP